MAKATRDEPRRVESPARMAVAEDPVVSKDVIELRHPDGRVDAIVNLGVGPGYVGEPSDGMVTDCILEIEASVTEPNPYHPIDHLTPRDGSLLEARAADGTEFLMVWRQTSQFDAKLSRWVPRGFWSNHLSRVEVRMEPVQWRSASGFNMPGHLVA